MIHLHMNSGEVIQCETYGDDPIDLRDLVGRLESSRRDFVLVDTDSDTSYVNRRNIDRVSWAEGD